MHIQGHVCMCWQVLTAQCLHLPCEDTPKTHLRVEKKGWQGQNPCSEWPLPVACPVPKPQVGWLAAGDMVWESLTSVPAAWPL
eukprot:1146841-Pelagomonas_calceolata.AAC.9